jgi:hypothetical protein
MLARSAVSGDSGVLNGDGIEEGDAVLDRGRRVAADRVPLAGRLRGPGRHLDPDRPAAADRPFDSGKHHKHGMNLHVSASLDGNILCVSGALPGSVYDKKAELIWVVLAGLEAAGLVVLADNG